LFYHQRLSRIRTFHQAHGGDLLSAFRRFQDGGLLEIVTSAATHAVLPLLANHPPSLRAQILVARDHYRSCFGRTHAAFGCRNVLTLKVSKKFSRKRTCDGL